MKIDALKLLAYGPFTGKILDFSGGGFGLHVVYGKNEAGKSTALRALIGLLFGFGHRIEDNWLHESKKLSVGGTFALNDGEILNITRYKRRKNDLIDEDSGHPLSQDELDKHLGRMGRDAFEHAFGISHESLRQGVGSVLAAGGDLGHALFAATSGMNSLKKVMDRLEELQAELFTPRGQIPAINAGISELASLRKEQREASASHVQWKKMSKELDALRQRELDAGNKLESLSAQISLFSRQQDALKYVARRKKLAEKLTEIGPVPELRPDFRDQRIETQVALKGVEQTRKNLEQELTEIDKRLDTLAYDNLIISNKTLIERLADESGIHAKALGDSKSLRARIYQHRESARQDLNLLRPGTTLEEAENLRLSKPEKTKIQRLAEKGIKLEEALKSVSEGLQSANAGMKNLTSRIGDLDSPVSLEELEDCLARATEQGKLEDRIAEIRGEEELLREKVDAELSALPLWKGDLPCLERLAIPAIETMRNIENELTASDRKLEDTRNESAKISEQLQAKKKELSGLATSKDLPSIEDLIYHRGLRDRGWQSVRKVWLEGGESDKEFMREFSRFSHLADAYEQSVFRADKTADTLYHEADSVARAESLKNEIRELEKSLEKINTFRAGLSEDHDALWSGWEKLWEDLSVAPLRPREMIEWNGRVGELRQRAEELRKAEKTSTRLRSLRDRIKEEITAALKRLDVDIPDDISFSSLLALACRTRDRSRKLSEERRSLELRIGDLKAEIETQKRRKTEIEQNLSSWSGKWSEAVSKLGFGAGARPEEVHDFVLALDDVFEELEKEKELRRRIAGMDRNYNDYSEKVADAAKNIAPDLESLAPETAALKLNARLKRHLEWQKEYHLLESEKRKKKTELTKVQQQQIGRAHV